MINNIRNNRFIFKPGTIVLSLIFLFQLIYPTLSLALTSGPSTPEVQSFEPVGTTQLVDPFTGDFNYNIPLMDVGGYPINMHYHAGIGMEQEASWVGLGWNINPGVINRDIRGVPDDFNGDEITYEQNVKKNTTVDLKIGYPMENLEVFGVNVEKLPLQKLDFGVSYNNYKGLGLTLGDYSTSTGFNKDFGFILNSVNITFLDPSGGYGRETERKNSLSIGYNSRSGLKSLNYGRKHNDRSVSSISHSFALQNYTPISKPHLSTSSASMTLKGGPELVGLYPNSSISIGLSETFIRNANKSFSRSAYGYLNAQNADEFSVMDKNNCDVSFNRFTKYLDHSVHTYDHLNVTGQGVGGSFRPYRNSVGSIADHSYSTDHKFDFNGLGLSGSLEYGASATVKVGYDIRPSISYFSSGRWKQCSSCDNKTLQNLKFSEVSNPISESYYYKGLGELTSTDEAYHSKIKGSNLIKLSLDDIEVLPSMSPSYIYDKIMGNLPSNAFEENLSIDNPIERTTREKRSQIIHSLTEKERQTYGIEKAVVNHAGNSPVSVNDAYRKGHHASEVTTITSDGSRYIYGVAAYGNTKDVTFAIGEVGTNHFSCITNGLVNYSEADASKNNLKGVDNFYQSTLTPKHAYAYHLTCILSPDYADITGDGPSADDFGNYTKFNYERLDSDFLWRVPHVGASINRGLLSNNLDDKANYAYGEKEVWYLKSIETKTHVAIFYTSPRQDGLGAKSEALYDLSANFKGDVFLNKLDSIKLFSREQFDDVLTLDLKSGAIAYKTVNFEYSYDLCSNVPNNFGTQIPTDHPLKKYFSNYNRSINANKGKLTLNKVYFTHGNSGKGQLNPYLFEYAKNTDYKIRSSDRWGTYTPFTDAGNNSMCSNLKSVVEFPYTDQSDREKSDENVAMWALSTIHLPSGSKLDIKYESDDYAYVQDKKAMEMMSILGFSNSNSITNLNQISDNFNDLNVNSLNGSNVNEYLYFDIDNNRTASDYLNDNEAKSIFFKFLINVKTDKKEYVSGFCEYESFGEVNIGSNKLAWIKLKPREDLNLSYNPIQTASFDFVRQNMPWMIWGGEDLINSGETNGDKISSLLFSVVYDFQSMVTGVYQAMLVRKLAASVDHSLSSIRVMNPYGKKIGGGHRVRSIQVTDNWNSFSAEENHFYGQVFDYTVSENNAIISSGVASYEPLVGGEEIPQRQAVYRRIKVPLGTDYQMYDDLPVCEDLYPAASVGYAKVSVRNIKPSDLGLSESVNNHGTGRTEYNFFTFRDFPTRSYATKLDKHISNSLVLNVVGINITKAIASQGYSIELNDMHGKPKSSFVYNEDGVMVSGSEYYYKSDGNRLNNTINVLNKDGTVSEATAGVDIETVIEPLESEELDITAGVQTNLDGFILGIIPAATWSVVPVWEYKHTQIKTATVTKIINRYGILESVKVIKNGSTLETKNLAWDAETGEVLLTASETQYKGKFDYNLSLPAHFAYEGMDAAYKNIGFSFMSVINSDAEISYPSNCVLTKGDELSVLDKDFLANPGYLEKAWVLDVDPATLEATVITESGEKYPPGEYRFKVIRSGRRNMQTLPIGNILMVNNPITGGRFDSYLNSNNNSVISAQAIEYSEQKQIYPILAYAGVKKCDGDMNQIEVSMYFPGGGEINPFNELLTVHGYGLASLSGVSNPPNRFLPCIDENSNCSVNYVNPYSYGILGCFYPFKTYTYYDKANPARSTSVNLSSSNPDFNTTRAQDDGLISGFVPFWTANSNGYWNHLIIDANNNELSDKWTWTTFSDIIDQNGNEIQSANPLGIKSSAQYGHNKQLPLAVANNAELSSILFDGFEEYTMGNLYPCPPSDYTASSVLNKNNKTSWHWMIWPNFTSGRANVISNDAHSGKQCLSLGHDVVEVPFSLPNEPTYPSLPTLKNQFYLTKSNSVQSFYPTNKTASGEYTYLMNYWAKYDKHTVNPLIQLQYFDGSSWQNIPCIEIEKQALPIDGWRRKSIEMKVPASVVNQKMRILIFKGIISTTSPGYKLNATQSELNGATVLLDDIRIMPKVSNMKCFVYDNVNYRLMAELDENHFATFYEYDDQGNLVRVKKETEKGIKTINESRSNIHKRP